MPAPIDQTHDPDLRSWVPGANAHPDFPIQNLPFAIYSRSAGGADKPRPCVGIGDFVLDLEAAAAVVAGAPVPASVLSTESLNDLFGLPAQSRLALRHWLSALFADDLNQSVVAPLLHTASGVRLHLPARIGDYTDFYVGIRHATNVGRQLRPENPLLPNYKFIPIGYHGRASSIRISGEPVIRPRGQRKTTETVPVFDVSNRLDYELELGVWIGEGNRLGHPIPIDEAARHIAGFSLLNDWSARDIQAWEYQPLGPFLAKNFHSTISPWIVTAEALAPFRIPQPARPDGDPAVLPYLWSEPDQASGALAVELEVHLRTAAMRDRGEPPARLARTEARNMYWTVAQMVAHHTSNGCNLNPGDLLGTGTISGPTGDSLGSLFEITEGGKTPLILPNGQSRTFLEDGDEVVMTARAQAEGRREIGFGTCAARILPAVAER